MRWLILSLGLLACSEPQPEWVTQPIELRAVDPNGGPLAGLRAWLDGALIGETKSDGIVQTTLSGRPGQRLSLSWACPPDHDPPTEQRDLALDRSLGPARKPVSLKLEARCAPLEIEAVLVVRAQGAPPEGVPIRVRDEIVARTDTGGLAHVLLRARRGSALTVALDTSAYPRLIPKSPIETFQLGEDDTILLLDRTLTTPAPKRKRQAAKQPPRVLPFRIQ